jgi:moderate conductance mechanosensitive channel
MSGVSAPDYLTQVLVVAGLALLASAVVWVIAGRIVGRLLGGRVADITRMLGLALVWWLALSAIMRLAGVNAWQVIAGPGARILIILGVAWLASNLLELATDRLKVRLLTGDGNGRSEPEQRIKTLVTVTRNAGLAVIGVVAGVMILRELGVDIGPILATAGVVGLAVSLGAQMLVRDIIAGILILYENQFHVGDVIQVGTVNGEVEELTLRATLVRDLNGALNIVPNGEMRILANKTRSWARAVVDVKVDRRADLAQILDALQQVSQGIEADSEISPSLLEPPAITGIEELSPATITLRVTAKVRPGTQWAVARAMRLRIKTALDGAEVETQASQPEDPPAQAAGGSSPEEVKAD